MRPLRTHINGRTPLLKFPPYSLFRPKGVRKSSNVFFFSHFHGLVPDINYKDLEGFVMLRTHSEPRRGEMSHICDISVLRVNGRLAYHYSKDTESVVFILYIPDLQFYQNIWVHVTSAIRSYHIN